MVLLMQKFGIALPVFSYSQRIKGESSQIRLDLDCSVALSYCEIDAVKITGKR